MKQKAIFLDRDGTIIKDLGYVYQKEKLEFLELTIEGLKKIQNLGYKLIIITNQSGVGRGYFNLTEMEQFNNFLLEKLKDKDVLISAIYTCPHHPDDNCLCRKPKTLLVEKAVKDFQIDTSQSFFIGDDEKDILCGKNSGCKTVWLKNSKSAEVKADHKINNLWEFADLLFEKPRRWRRLGFSNNRGSKGESPLGAVPT